MLKKLYLLLPLTALFTLSGTHRWQFSDTSWELQDISWNFKKNPINCPTMSDESKFLTLTCFTEQRINHITNEYNTIIFELVKENEVFIQAIKRIKNKLKDDYRPFALQVTMLVNTILESEEFNTAFLQNIDYILNCIVKHGDNFNDIVVPYKNAILDDKIEEELIKAFLVYNELAEELFSAFYLLAINQMGCNLLLKKLLIEKYKLIKEMYEIGYSVYGSID